MIFHNPIQTMTVRLTCSLKKNGIYEDEYEYEEYQKKVWVGRG